MSTRQQGGGLWAFHDAVSIWMKRLDTGLRYFLALGMAIIMLAIIFHVCGRYFFGMTYMGTMEIVRYTMIWVSMAGAACAFGSREHVCINFFQGRLSTRQWFWVNIAGNVVLLAFIVAMIRGGVTISIRNWHQTSLGMQIPMLFPYLAIPIGGAIMIPYILHDLLGRTARYLSDKGDLT